VAINCAGVPRELLESELFGSEPGAFTGAVARPGRFEQAKGGTLFLDEIGDLSPSAQATLLRVLDQKVVQRLGGARDIPVDARVVAATNVDLDRTMAAGGFRADLLYRLRQLVIRLPPLRERGHDLTQIIDARLPAICLRAGVVPKDISEAAGHALRGHDWPGNVRELEHALLYAVAHAGGTTIQLSDLPETLQVKRAILYPAIPARPEHLSLSDACAALVAAAEHQWIQAEVTRCHTLGEVARALGLNAKTLYEKMARYSIERRRS
jgi:Nif-specific regulatory protein